MWRGGGAADASLGALCHSSRRGAIHVAAWRAGNQWGDVGLGGKTIIRKDETSTVMAQTCAASEAQLIHTQKKRQYAGDEYSNGRSTLSTRNTLTSQKMSNPTTTIQIENEAYSSHLGIGWRQMLKRATPCGYGFQIARNLRLSTARGDPRLAICPTSSVHRRLYHSLCRS
jgi:hypothetical protein